MSFFDSIYAGYEIHIARACYCRVGRSGEAENYGIEIRIEFLIEKAVGI